MYFSWQAAFSILLWSNTPSRVKLLKGSIPTPLCSSLEVFPQFQLISTFSLLSIEEELGISHPCLEDLDLPCLRLRMNDTMEAHPLSVHRMGE